MSHIFEIDNDRDGNENIRLELLSKGMSDGVLTDQEQEELRLLYTVTANDIAFFKRQQWIVTNYAVVVYAVLITLGTELLESTNTWEKVLLGIFAGATAVAGCIILHQLQASIKVRRARLEKIRPLFSERFHESWAALQKPSDYILPVLYAVIVLGLGIVEWVLSRN